MLRRPSKGVLGHDDDTPGSYVLTTALAFLQRRPVIVLSAMWWPPWSGPSVPRSRDAERFALRLRVKVVGRGATPSGEWLGGGRGGASAWYMGVGGWAVPQTRTSWRRKAM